jgi:hypothetical protein
MADPGERSLDDPSFGEHDEAMQFIALDNREPPSPLVCLTSSVYRWPHIGRSVPLCRALGKLKSPAYSEHRKIGLPNITNWGN